MLKEDSRAPNIGLSQPIRREIAEGLTAFLADTLVLSLQTRQFHWNVVGPMFMTLHALFDDQHADLNSAVDLIAERIRSLGFLTPNRVQLLNMSTLQEAENDVLTDEEMLAYLVESHEKTLKTARQVFFIAEEASDYSTSDLLSERMYIHEKNAWVLRSFVQN